MQMTAPAPPPPPRDPLLALAMGEIRGVLALVIRTQGPSYRSVGAAMVFAEDGTRIGSLSSGCIEADLALHAHRVRQSGTPLRILYGVGSPYMDIQLPCGGGLEILLLPQPRPEELALVSKVETDRRPVDVSIALESGRITAAPCAGPATGLRGASFILRLTPQLRFVVFGKGPEAISFARLVQSLGYRGDLVSPDPETRVAIHAPGWQSHKIQDPICPPQVSLDPYTAVVLFFHDHEWEAPILRDVLQGQPCYIGSQGSRQASENRLRELQDLGVPDAALTRLRGPIGLIPSARDANTLAVSVLAEILAQQ